MIFRFFVWDAGQRPAMFLEAYVRCSTSQNFELVEQFHTALLPNFDENQREYNQSLTFYGWPLKHATQENKKLSAIGTGLNVYPALECRALILQRYSCAQALAYPLIYIVVYKRK
jgi:hypothetical protein